MCPGSPDTQLRFLQFHSAEISLCCLWFQGNPWRGIENHFCFVDLFFPFIKKKLVILIMFVVKEMEVHDGTVGGGVSSLLFLLASPRTEF